MSEGAVVVRCTDCQDDAHLVWTERLRGPSGGAWLCSDAMACRNRVERRIYVRRLLSGGDWTLKDVDQEREALCRRPGPNG